MALDRETVGLVFKLRADTSQLAADETKVKAFLASVTRGNDTVRNSANGLQESQQRLKRSFSESARGGALQLAQAQARLRQSFGDTAGAIRILSNALENEKDVTVGTINANRQLLALQTRANATRGQEEAALLRTAQAQARYQQYIGDTANGIRILERALDGVSRDSLPALRANLQLALLRNDYENSPLIKSIRGIGDESQKQSRIAREAFITASSEIIESWGVDGDIANEVGRMLNKLPVFAKVALAGMGAAFVAGAAVLVGYAKGLELIEEKSKKLGTSSKDDWEKIQKAAKTAGVEFTAVERNMAQGVVKEFEKLRTVADKAFAVFLAQAAPGVIQSLRILSNLLIQNQGAIATFGKIAGNAFISVSAGIKTAAENLKLFLLAIPASPLGLTIAGPKLFSEFQKNAKEAQDAAAKITVPKATFESGGKAGRDKIDKSGEESLALYQAQAQAAEDLAQREVELARRAFEAKSLGAKDYERIAIEAESNVLAAKQSAFERERATILKDRNASNTEKATRLQEVNNAEQQAIRDHEDAVYEIKQAAYQEELRLERERSDARMEDIEAEREQQVRELQQLSEYLEARNQLFREVGQARVNTKSAEADDLEQQARTQPRLREAARAARQDALLAEFEFQKRMTLLQLEADEMRLKALAATKQQELGIEAQYDLLRLEAVKQFQIKRQSIEDQYGKKPQTLGGNILDGIFGPGFAESAARGESIFAGLRDAAANFQEQMRQMSESLPSLVEVGFGAIRDGLTEMAVAFVLTGQTGPAAMRQLAAGVLAAIAKMAATKAIYELAEGFAALARGFFGDPRGFVEAGHHFTAAAIYGAVGAATGLAARAVAPGGGAGNFSQGENRPEKRVIEQGNRQNAAQPQVIIIRAETHPDVTISRVKEDFRGNGELRTLFRSDLVGEGAR